MSNSLIPGSLALLIFIALGIPVAAASAAGPPAMIWEKTFNITGSDTAKDLCQTPDGGFVFVGSTITSTPMSLTQRLCCLPGLIGTGMNYGEGSTRDRGIARDTQSQATSDGGFVIAGAGVAHQARIRCSFSSGRMLKGTSSGRERMELRDRIWRICDPDER